LGWLLAKTYQVGQFYQTGGERQFQINKPKLRVRVRIDIAQIKTLPRDS